VQDAARAQDPAKVSEAWDALLPAAAASRPREAKPSADFRSRFYLEDRADYWRYSTAFTGLPTATGIIDAPANGVFNPAGMPYPDVFQGAANRITNVLDWGTRGWLSDRVDTHFGVRYAQDVTGVAPGAPAAGLLETLPGHRELQLTNASMEFHGEPVSFELGRLSVYGAELASLDGASLTVERRNLGITFFGGRRVTFYSDPLQRAIGGVNVVARLSPDSTLEYGGLWYVHGSNRLTWRRRLGPAWLVSASLRAYGSAVVEASAQALYAPVDGKTMVRLAFTQKPSSRDDYYDYAYLATDRDPHNSAVRLNLGTIASYSQVVADVQRSLTPRLRVGGAAWIRHLDAVSQGPFDTSYEDYRAHARVVAMRQAELSVEYHQRHSDRLSPVTAVALDDMRAVGETTIKDVDAEVRRSFAEGRVTVNGGAFYRNISMQDAFMVVSGSHEAGWLAGVRLTLDPRTRLYVDYSLDKDFFLFRPDIANSRTLRLGLLWKY
jgi:hypothetical protein